MKLSLPITMLVSFATTTAAMSAAIYANSLFVMGIQDAHAWQCSLLSALMLNTMLIVALCQVGHGGEARWYPRTCVIMVAVALFMLLKGALLRPVPTLQLVIDGWVILLIIAAMNGLRALGRAVARRWS